MTRLAINVFGGCVLLLIVTCSASAQLVKKAPQKPHLPGNWKTTFEDNFDGDSLDSHKWKIGQHWAAINGGAQPHPNNVEVSKGVLRIKWDKKKQPFNFGQHKNQNYASGEVSTYKRFHQKYGYLEARMKYDVTRGCWPAFWTMPANRPTKAKDDMRWTYIKFDLKKAPRTIKQATLKMKVTRTDSSPFYDVYRCLDDKWKESSITWNNKPSFDALFVSHVNPAPAKGEWLSVDITEYIKAERKGDNIATLVLADVLQRKNLTEFVSKEGVQSDRPYLDIDGNKFPVLEDAYVFAKEPNKNFGSEAKLSLYDGYGYMVYTKDGGMEIDILEVLGMWGKKSMLHALHWDGYGKHHKKAHQFHKTVDGLDLSTWTTTGVHWTKGKLEFYINGKKTWTYENANVCSVPSFIILSAQIGGWGGNGHDKEKHFDPNLPAYLDFDYVKVWAPADTPTTTMTK